MNLVQKKNLHVSEQEYLEGEKVSDIKHEYIDGHVYAMAGASVKHNTLCTSISANFYNGLKRNNSNCRVFTSDMKVKVSQLFNNNNYYYPDLMIVCDLNDEDDYYQNSPVIIVEVLSKSTSKFDKSQKRLSYFTIPSLKEYVLIEQDKCEIVVFDREKGWQSSYYFLGDQITFNSIDVTISVEAIYYQIENEEITQYLLEKQQQQKKAEEENS